MRCGLNLLQRGLLLLLSATSAPGLASEEPASSPIVLRFSHFLGPDTFFQREIVEPWSRELEHRTEGRVKVKILNAADPAGDVRLQSTNVRSGVVDIALGLRGAEGDGAYPATSLVELPGLVRSGSCGARLLWSLHQSGALTEEYSGFKVLALFAQNPALIHTRARPVRNPEDLAGLRMRASSDLVAGILTSMGAIPRRSNDPGVISSELATGELDGVVTNWGNPIPAFESMVRHHTDVPIAAPVFFVLMNSSRYDALPPSVRQIVDEMSGETWSLELGARWDVWDERIRTRAKESGAEFITPDAVSSRIWRAVLREQIDQHLGKLGARLPDAGRLFRILEKAATSSGCSGVPNR